MRLMHSPSLLAGFHGESPDPAIPEINRAGEEWLLGRELVHPHCHHDFELYLQVDGTTWWEGPDRGYILKPGCLFIPPPGVVHTLRGCTQGRHHFIFAGIDIDVVLKRMPELSSAWDQKEIIFRSNGGTLLAPFRLLVREVALNQPYRTAGLRSTLDAMIVEASRIIEQGERPTLLVPSHLAVARAKTLIETEPQLPWRLRDLAQGAGVSASRLLQLFTKEVGIPPRQLLLQVRIERAKDLLQTTDTSISQIGVDLGFASSQHFAVVFRRITGETASSFRSRMQTSNTHALDDLT